MRISQLAWIRRSSARKMAKLHIPLFLFRLRVWLMVQIVFLGDGTARSSRGSVRWTFASQGRRRYRLAGQSIVVPWWRSVWLGSCGRFDIALVSVRTRTPEWQLSPSLLGMISSSGMLPASISGVRVHPDGMLFFISEMTFWSWVGWNSAADSLSMAAKVRPLLSRLNSCCSYSISRSTDWKALSILPLVFQSHPISWADCQLCSGCSRVLCLVSDTSTGVRFCGELLNLMVNFVKFFSCGDPEQPVKYSTTSVDHISLVSVLF